MEQTLTNQPTSAIALGDGEGERLWVLGDLYTLKATGTETGGSYMACEIEIAPGNGTPPHLHQNEDELFYVRKGTLQISLEDRQLHATCGSFIHAPRGQRHFFRNDGSEKATLLVLAIPAGFENFLREIGQSCTDITTPPPITEKDLELLQTTAPKYGIELLPPE